MCQCFHLLGFTPSTVCVEILRQSAVFLHPPRCVLTDSRLLLLCFSHTSLKTGTNIEPLEAWLSTVDRFLCAVVCVLRFGTCWRGTGGVFGAAYPSTGN